MPSTDKGFFLTITALMLKTRSLNVRHLYMKAFSTFYCVVFFCLLFFFSPHVLGAKELAPQNSEVWFLLDYLCTIAYFISTCSTCLISAPIERQVVFFSGAHWSAPFQGLINWWLHRQENMNICQGSSKIDIRIFRYDKAIPRGLCFKQ